MAAQIGRERNSIEEEWLLVEKMVLSAKGGQWKRVFDILAKYPHVINLIPETRRWGVLHQAVWWRDEKVLQRLLSMPGCDRSLKSKTCTSEKGETEGKDAIEIAQMYGYIDMEQLLQNYRPNVKSTGTENTTFAAYDTKLLDKGLVAIGLAGFKKTFHPSTIDKTRSVVSVLEGAFKKMQESNEFLKKVKDQVCDTLVVVNKDASRSIESSSSTINDFLYSIVNDYTREDTFLYDHANTALRRQTETGYIPDAEDLALAPYIIVYLMCLLFWPELKRESAKTFRRVRLSKAQADQYTIGKKFTWLGFVSSSAELKKAIPFPTCHAEGDNVVIFIIDNSEQSMWQPRNIEKYARYQERERVYPSGARFQVIGRKVDKNNHIINLKLIN